MLMSCTPARPSGQEAHSLAEFLARLVGEAHDDVELHVQLFPDAPRTDSSSRSSFTTFLIRLSTSGDPLSGA